MRLLYEIIFAYNLINVLVDLDALGNMMQVLLKGLEHIVLGWKLPI